MKKSKKQEKKKRKVRTLILLLFLTIIMFGTSTYAWFTANKVVTINSLDVHVEASGGIQISTDGTNWKSVITNSDIKKGYIYNKGTAQEVSAVNQVPGTVTAVSTDAVATAAGRINMYSSIIDNDASTGDYNIKTALETDVAGEDGAAYEDGGKYIAFDIFLRLDSTQNVYLTPDSNVTVAANSTDRGLKNAARVAFINLGHTTSSATPTEIVSLNTGVNSSVIVWEPNVDAHTPIVVSSVAPEYGVQLTEVLEGGNPTGFYAPVNYRGVNSVVSTAVDLKNFVNGTLTANTTSISPFIQTKATNAEYKTFVSNMAEGVTKYRVYMWIEGQDIDCENNATGSDVSFKVQLSTTNQVTSTSTSTSTQTSTSTGD